MTKLRSSTETIRNIFAITLFLISTSSCNSQDTLTDPDNNKYPIRKLPDNHWWLTTNLKLNIPDSYCYDNKKENCDKYGRLYTWETAKKVCATLGEGWRLPTNDEWRGMTKHFGGDPEELSENRKKAYKVLLSGGSSEFNALLGGGREVDGDKYARLEAHGFYWTATENDSSNATFMNFAKGSGSLYHQTEGEKVGAFSVRCVK